ncbi:MAG: DUF624 domain-containing protein [Cellulomonas sp.]
MRRISHSTYETVFSAVFVGLMTNLLLVVGCLPLLVVLITTDTALSWPLVALLVPLSTPAVGAAFAVFAAYSADPTIRVVRTFAQAWRAGFRRAAALGALATGTLVVLGVDARGAWGRPAGVWAVPVLAVLIVLVVATTLLGLVALAEVPRARLRDVLGRSAVLALRRWYLTLASLFILALLLSLLAVKPALALGLAAAPLLYVVWANSRYSLRTVLPTAAGALTSA